MGISSSLLKHTGFGRRLLAQNKELKAKLAAEREAHKALRGQHKALLKSGGQPPSRWPEGEARLAAALPNLDLPGVPELASRLCLAVSELDIMILKTSPEHYLGVGASALKAILSGAPELSNKAPRRILDFGSGYGRVARFLSAQWPGAELRVCDVDFPGIAFCMTHLGALGFQVGTDPDLYNIEPIHDLIWVGSVVTHLDATNIKKLLTALHAGLAPGGYLCFTTHDAYPVERMKSGNFDYCLDAEGIKTVVTGYEQSGYGYADYPDVKGYGVSATTPAWIKECADSVGGWVQVDYQPRGWDNHQEVVIYQRDR